MNSMLPGLSPVNARHWTCRLSLWSEVPHRKGLVMERARFGKARISAFVSARSAATYLVELSIVANTPSFSDSVVSWLTWWLADAAGTLVITPVVVLWAMMPIRRFSKWDLLESVAVSILVSIIGIVAYSPLIGSNLISNHFNVP